MLSWVWPHQGGFGGQVAATSHLSQAASPTIHQLPARAQKLSASSARSRAREARPRPASNLVSRTLLFWPDLNFHFSEGWIYAAVVNLSLANQSWMVDSKVQLGDPNQVKSKAGNLFTLDSKWVGRVPG